MKTVSDVCFGHCWPCVLLGCVGRRVNSPCPHLLKNADVVSCCLDLTAPCISFRVNGLPVQGMLENFSVSGPLHPVVSFSAGVRSVMTHHCHLAFFLYLFFMFSPSLNVLSLNSRFRFLFGGRHGEFRFLPPPGFAPCTEALLPRMKLKVEPCQKYILDQELVGPSMPVTPVVFTPAPVDISKVGLRPWVSS